MIYNKILVIDDDTDLGLLLKKCVINNGSEVELAYTGAKGFAAFKAHKYDLIVLDVMLPDISGFSLLEQIRKISTVPVLMLTAKNEEDDKVRGLQLGADDYLTKPFSVREFIARVNSLLRRSITFSIGSKCNKEEFQFKKMVINTDTRAVFVSGVPIKLTAREFDLLYFLAANKGKIFTKSQLYNQVWQADYAFDDNNIMAFISKLRKKIEIIDDSPEYIQTIRGVGYRFNPEV